VLGYLQPFNTLWDFLVAHPKCLCQGWKRFFDSFVSFQATFESQVTRKKKNAPGRHYPKAFFIHIVGNLAVLPFWL
jgi:hypothetical protein